MHDLDDQSVKVSHAGWVIALFVTFFTIDPMPKSLERVALHGNDAHPSAADRAEADFTPFLVQTCRSPTVPVARA